MRAMTTGAQPSAQMINSQLQQISQQLQADAKKSPTELQLLARTLLRYRKAMGKLPGDATQLWAVYEECEALWFHHQSKQQLDGMIG